MSKIEKIAILILLISALSAFIAAYYVKHSGGKIEIVSPHEAREADSAQDAMSEKRTVNINTANKTLIMKLPGIGPALADDIITFRTQNGSFGAPEELMKVKGIGRKKYEQIKDLVKIDA